MRVSPGSMPGLAVGSIQEPDPGLGVAVPAQL